MDNNYFSDITELFIKAKKAEKIEVNPHNKAAIREMLAYKVDEMNTAKEAPAGNFFNKWKFQLMGVPASIFAVFLVVFAFQNLQVTMPKEDFTPEGANEGQIEIEAKQDPIVKDIAIIEEADEQAPKPKPELLVIDYSETTQPIAQPTATSQPKTQPIKTGGTDTPPVYQPAEVADQPYIAPVEEQKTAQSTQDYTSNSENSQPSTGGGETTYTPPTTSGGYTMISEDLSDTDTTIYTVPAPEVDVPKYDINPDEVGDMIDGGMLLPKTEPDDTEAINEFRDPFNPLVPEFDTEALNTIEKTDTLDNVNVHYLNKDQAAVEVIEDDSTRWYMFETIDGKWTVTQKFD